MGKIFIFILIPLTLTISKLNGQIIKNIGLKTGLCFANQIWYYKSINLKLQKKYREGFNSAITVEFFNNPNFNFITDLNYSQKGSKEIVEILTADNPETANGTVTMYTRFDYISLNLLGKANYEIKKIGTYLIAGPRIDYLLLARSTSEVTTYDYRYYDLEKIIIGLTYGFGVDYKIKKIGIGVELQHQYDITNAMDTEPLPNKSGLKITNNSFFVNLTIKYFLK